jgi:hypothetical protein
MLLVGLSDPFAESVVRDELFKSDPFRQFTILTPDITKLMQVVPALVQAQRGVAFRLKDRVKMPSSCTNSHAMMCPSYK